MPFHRPIRCLLPCVMAMQVVATQAHCTYGGVIAVREMTLRTTLAQRGLSLPINRPAGGCDNESGCMCRGATVVAMLDASQFARDFHWLELLLPRAAFGNELATATLARPLRDNWMHTPTLSGRSLRAHIASLLN